MWGFNELLDAARSGLGVPLRAVQRLTRGQQQELQAAWENSRPARQTSPTTGDGTVSRHHAPPEGLPDHIRAAWSAAPPNEQRALRALYDEAGDRAEARGYERGRAAFRARFRAITECDEAQGRGRLAQSLALSTDMDADECRRLLAASPVEDDDTPDPLGFRAHCRQLGVEPPGNGASYGDDDPEAVAARIVGAGRRGNGSDT